MWKMILAAMMFLQQPGQSIYSKVVVPVRASAPCNDVNSLLCQRPVFSPDHNSFVVVENKEQGTERYSLIAETIDRVVNDPGTVWKTPKDRMWKFVVTVAYHESGFRRDVHSGIGPAAKGDCEWTGKKPGEGKIVSGSCKSWCMGQILLGRTRKLNGWRGRDLVGLDKESTYRCMYATAKHLDSSYDSCSKQGLGEPSSYCVFQAYGGVRGQRNKQINKRVGTYNRLSRVPITIDSGPEATLNK